MNIEDRIILDVRNIIPRERHPKIFNTFDGLTQLRQIYPKKGKKLSM